ncbi:hypothetical protein VTJ49DRAFT_2307 [Mycothermus thermophilus]|uniref:Uncharacterized protein n=1 Tax=Humicola insolens TaxID=85995 RepID=A0ABR3VR08_HUMIN
MTTYYYMGDSCSGTTALGYYHANVEGDRSVSVTVDLPCGRTCTTVMIYEASPTVGPSLSWIGCPEMLGLPQGVYTIYSQRPDITDITSTSSSRTRTTRTTDNFPSETQTSSTGSPTFDSSNTADDSSSSSGPNAGVIVGAVVGSIAGVAIILLAFFLGWRYASRKNKPTTTSNPPTNPPPNPPTQPYYTPELEGAKVQAGVPVSTSPAPTYDPAQQHQSMVYNPALQQQQQPMVWNQNQGAWGHQSVYYPQTGQMPTPQQLPTDTGPYEIGSSYPYTYQEQTGTYVTPTQPAQPAQLEQPDQHLGQPLGPQLAQRLEQQAEQQQSGQQPPS